MTLAAVETGINRCDRPESDARKDRIMTRLLPRFAGLIAFVAALPASAQWITFTNQTANRLPTGNGTNDPALTTLDPEEKDYTWGDVDHDGDIDLICVRKRPLGCEGGRRNLLLMNENGELIDRAATLAS